MCTAHRYFRFKSCAPAGGSGFEWWERLLFTRLEFYGKLLSNQFAQFSEWWVGTAATDTRSRTIARTYFNLLAGTLFCHTEPQNPFKRALRPRVKHEA